MGDFDVKFRNYERAMHANNNFGLSGDALAQQYGRYAEGLQRAQNKAASKAEGRAFARDLAIERNLRRQDYIRFWEQKGAPRAEALMNAQNASRPFSITADQIDSQFGLNRQAMTAAERADYEKFWEQNTPPQAQEPKTWERYAKEHGTTYKKPANGVQAADQIAERRIQLDKLEKEIETLKQSAKSNPNANGVIIADKIAAKRMEANALENEIAQIKAGLQTPKADPKKAAKKTPAPVKEPVKAPVAPETPVVKQDLPKRLEDGFEAIVEDPDPVQETHTGTKAEPAREVATTPEEAPVEGTPAEKKVKPSRQERLKNNPELAERYERFCKSAKNSSKLKGLKKAGKWGAIAALAVGAGALLLKACSKDEKPAAPVQEENTQETAQNPAPAETAPEEQAPAQETPAAPQEPENAEIAAVKGDDYWKYARMELIAEHQGEVDYKPTDTEIYGRMKEIMKRADIGMAEDNVHPDPMLYVNDKVELDAETAKLRNEAINQLKEEHKDQEGYEPTYNEVVKKFEELAAGKTEKVAA